MRRIAATLAVVGALLFSAGSAWADYDDGFAAYQRGDYETAYREFLPLAEQGHAQAQSLIRDAVSLVSCARNTVQGPRRMDHGGALEALPLSLYRGRVGIWSKGTRLCDQWHDSLGVDLGVAIEIGRKTPRKHRF